MTHKTRFIKADRRSFLKGATVASGVALVAPTAALAAEVPVAPVEPSSGDKGYEENDYIRTYYDRARF